MFRYCFACQVWRNRRFRAILLVCSIWLQRFSKLQVRRFPAEFQGQSHWTQLKAGTSWSEPAIAESVAGCTNPFRGEDRRGSRLLAVRDAEYKLVLNFAAQTEYLFNLKLDPGERSSLPETRGKTGATPVAGDRPGSFAKQWSRTEFGSLLTVLPANQSAGHRIPFESGSAGRK